MHRNAQDTIRPLIRKWPGLGFGVVLALTSCSPAPESTQPGATETPAAVIPATVALSVQDKAKILKSLPAPYNAADLENGGKQFNKCRSCHTLYAGEMALVGPNLYTLFGRKAGTLSGYTYSDAMKAHNVVWGYDTLNTYLEAPQDVVVGTRMGFMGIKSPNDRRDVIAYIRIETSKAP